MKSMGTWVVVADGAQAQFFRLLHSVDGVSLRIASASIRSGLMAHARDERSDRPGRSFASGKTGARAAIEPRHDFHKLAKHEFARRIVSEIVRASSSREFERLVLVAPARMLGELRALLPQNTREKIWQEIPKDLVKHTQHELWRRLAPLLSLRKGAAGDTEEPPGRGENGGQIAPPIVQFRDLRPSEAIIASINKHAAKFARMSSRVTSCRATVEGSHAHHRHGKLYRVSIELTVPGKRISASSSRNGMYAHEDVHAAIRDAFEAAGKQLLAHVRRASGRSSLQSSRSSSLRERRADNV